MTVCQNQVKMGLRSLPTVMSVTTAPISSPAEYPGRRSAPQTAKPRYSQAQTAPAKNSRSLSTVCLGRSGRRKPYSVPSPAPIRQLTAKCRKASAGGVIQTTGSASRRYAGVPRR